MAELGCNKGVTAALLQSVLRAHRPSTPLHVYDSFEGLPQGNARTRPRTRRQEPWPAPPKTCLIRSRARPPSTDHPQGLVRRHARRGALATGFAHVDGDLYASITDALELIYDRLAPGAICVVDDVTLSGLAAPRHLPRGLRRVPRLFAGQARATPRPAGARIRRSTAGLAGEGATRRTRISRKFNLTIPLLHRQPSNAPNLGVHHRLRGVVVLRHAGLLLDRCSALRRAERHARWESTRDNLVVEIFSFPHVQLQTYLSGPRIAA